MAKQTLIEKIGIHIISYYCSALGILLFAFLKIGRFITLCLFNTVSVGTFRPPVPNPNFRLGHEANVFKVQKQVKAWNADGRKTKMCTGRPGWRTLSIRTPIYKKGLTGINLNMNRLVHIKNEENKKPNVCVEPMMKIGDLTYELEMRGWALPVVPELNDLTIGGLVCGAGVETSSHKYGLFHNICLSYEVVLSSGEVVTCTEKENSDLFYAIPGSHGTLGFLTAVELEIIPAKPYVKLEYIPVRSLDEAISVFKEQTERSEGNEFVEGFMFSLESGVIMVGKMVTEPDFKKVNSIGNWYKPWFYKHAETFLNETPENSSDLVEYIPLRDYYHRHTKGLFWETANFIPYGNNPVFRYLFGWVLPVRVDFVKLLAPKCVFRIFDSKHVTQDFVIPMDKLKEALILSHKVTQVYPIWLCPAKLKYSPGVCHFLDTSDEMYVDVGIYGMSALDEYDVVSSARALELFCLENRGYQALYSDVCMTREEFGRMFKHELYLKMRKELNCEDAFPDVYEKVCRAARE